MYDNTKFEMKIKMIESTTAPVVAFPTPAAPPRVESPWYEPTIAMMAPKTTDLKSPFTTSYPIAWRADEINTSLLMCAYD